MVVKGFSAFGYEETICDVEVDLRRGIPAVDIVGLADSAVKNTRELVMSAIKKSHLNFPSERVLISVSPADLKKEYEFAFPIAMGIINAMTEDTSEFPENLIVHGELTADGHLFPTRGTYAALMTARNNGVFYAIVPKGTLMSEIPNGMHVMTVETLEEAYLALPIVRSSVAYEQNTPKDTVEFPSFDDWEDMKDFDWSTVHPAMKRAMTIAAAGKLNMLVTGAPGCGKTLALQRFPMLLPKLTEDEQISVKKIHSIAGLNGHDMSTTPFRMPHQTASIEGMCGGGVNCRPGEISLAHNGVLFLNEAAEFRSANLQMLRVPLENGNITLSRAGRSTVYPANFQLLMATNPCPCGNYGSKDRICLCSARSIEQYWKKFSVPLLDRVQIKVNMDKLEDTEDMTLEQMREKIANAIAIQRKEGMYNRNLTTVEIDHIEKTTDKDAYDYMIDAAQSNDFSVRTTTNIIRIAKTIANMDNRTKINLTDMKEAVKLTMMKIMY